MRRRFGVSAHLRPAETTGHLGPGRGPQRNKVQAMQPGSNEIPYRASEVFTIVIIFS